MRDTRLALEGGALGIGDLSRVRDAATESVAENDRAKYGRALLRAYMTASAVDGNRRHLLVADDIRAPLIAS